MLADLPFLEEVCYVFVAGRLRGRAVGGKSSSGLYRLSHGDEVDVHCAQFILLFLLYYSFVGVSSPLRMFSRVLGVRGLLSLGGMLYVEVLGCCMSSWSV